MKSEPELVKVPFTPEEDETYDALLREFHDIRTLKAQDVYRNADLFDPAKSAQHNAENVLDLYQAFIKTQASRAAHIKKKLTAMIEGRSRH